MARWSTFFVVLAILAGAFGLSNLDAAEGSSGRTVFFVLLGLGAVCLALEHSRHDR